MSASSPLSPDVRWLRRGQSLPRGELRVAASEIKATIGRSPKPQIKRKPIMSSPPTHIIHPSSPHRASIIWLHGLGADGYDFAPIAAELDLTESLGLKYIFPHAPMRPITCNQGLSMRGWYDIITLDREHFIHDTEGVLASSHYVHKLIANEQAHGIPPERILLAGFSQGGAIALFAGLTSAVPLAGILALSTYVPAPEALTSHYIAMPRNILMLHGDQDTLIPLAAAASSRDLLQQLGQAPEFRVYPMGHGVCPEELLDIKTWIKQSLQI